MNAEAGTEIAVIRTALPTILAADENDILGKLAAKVKAHKADISTNKGRDEIRSLAAEIASSKVTLVKLGKSLTEGWRKSTNAVNEECNVIEEKMDALKVQVRQPLTDFENAEKARVAAHEAVLAAVAALVADVRDMTSDAILSRLVELEQIDKSGRVWEEFTMRAITEIAATGTFLRHALDDATALEAQAAELAALRAADIERQRIAGIEAQRVREERIRAEAAEAATRQAEAKAARDAEVAAAAVQRATEAAERKAAAEVMEAENHARASREMAAAAQARVVEAEAKAARDLAAAVIAEQKRAADVKAAEDAETARREANVAHRKKINGDALTDIVNAISGVHSGTAAEAALIAKAIVVALAKNEIRCCKIGY